MGTSATVHSGAPTRIKSSISLTKQEKAHNKTWTKLANPQPMSPNLLCGVALLIRDNTNRAKNSLEQDGLPLVSRATWPLQQIHGQEQVWDRRLQVPDELLKASILLDPSCSRPRPITSCS